MGRLLDLEALRELAAAAGALVCLTRLRPRRLNGRLRLIQRLRIPRGLLAYLPLEHLDLLIIARGELMGGRAAP